MTAAEWPRDVSGARAAALARRRQRARARVPDRLAPARARRVLRVGLADAAASRGQARRQGAGQDARDCRDAAALAAGTLRVLSSLLSYEDSFATLWQVLSRFMDELLTKQGDGLHDEVLLEVLHTASHCCDDEHADQGSYLSDLWYLCGYKVRTDGRTERRPSVGHSHCALAIARTKSRRSSSRARLRATTCRTSR